MGFPILLLFVFLGKAVSLEGSQDGIREYIGIWDMSVLTEMPEVWSEACTQIFFSIGITFGILPVDAVEVEILSRDLSTMGSV